MKFAREYQDHLAKGGFPADWVSSSISYGQLKKCIKRVQSELCSLGLDVVTLHRLLESVESQAQAAQSPGKAAEDQNDDDIPDLPVKPVDGDDDVQEKPFQYTFTGAGVGAGTIRPKLLFVVDAETGEPLDASLSPETRNYLHQLAVCSQLTDVRIAEEPLELVKTVSGSSDGDEGETHSITSLDSQQQPKKSRKSRPRRFIEVPLTTDSEFFDVLERELSGLVRLQDEEKRKLSASILDVGRKLGHATNPSDNKGRNDLTHWRRLFELYIESNIFFATCEQDHGSHTGDKAQVQYEQFLKNAKKVGLLKSFKRNESTKALQMFLDINDELLRSLKFQEINQIAMTKILKKFDKRTALGAKITFPSYLRISLVSEDFSKALASQVSTNIISVVPQLDDYLCPICCEIAFRPIRLRCSHLFCIRCLIVMQRARKDNCPLCREPCVLDADSSNLDESMQNFLRKYFHDEAKKKQKANEVAAYWEQHPDIDGPGCIVM